MYTQEALITEVENQFDNAILTEMKALPQIDLKFENLSIWVNTNHFGIFSCKKANKLILNSLSGEFKAGTSTAILGPSGSGKTTLLNFLSSRMRSKNIHKNGKLFINGQEIDSLTKIKHRFGYVMQDDILFEDLSVYE